MITSLRVKIGANLEQFQFQSQILITIMILTIYVVQIPCDCAQMCVYCIIVFHQVLQ